MKTILEFCKNLSGNNYPQDYIDCLSAANTYYLQGFWSGIVALTIVVFILAICSIVGYKVGNEKA